MNPQELFCPNLKCLARGQVGKGNIHIHSLSEQRCICEVCKQTFSTTTGTIFYRLRHAPELVIQVITLVANGCPVQAIVKAFGLDERTVRDWQKRAGQHCQQVHEHLVESRQHDLQQVQADEIKVKTQKGSYWMALAIWVPTRLWLGGVVSPRRDLDLIQSLANKVRKVALCRPLLLAVDGLATYVSAFRHAFRSKLPRPPGEDGRCKLIAWAEIAIVQVVKEHLDGVWRVDHRIVQGAAQQVAALIRASQGQGGINTAFIERLNATFRQRINALTRRTRTLAQCPQTLTAGMYLLGCFYNFCDFHHSLRLKLSVGSFGYRWVQRTPALAAGLTDHQWTPMELFNFRVPPPPWQIPKRRGRHPSALLQLAKQWAI